MWKINQKCDSSGFPEDFRISDILMAWIDKLNLYDIEMVPSDLFYR